MKSGYPDYLKSGFTRTILVTEKHASNSDTQIVKITLILEHFFNKHTSTFFILPLIHLKKMCNKLK